MKGVDGFELYNNMRNIDENVQVCFITASNTFFEKYKKLYPGIEKECFIQKPTDYQKKCCKILLKSRGMDPLRT
jgi:two-component SAPR family response regulator